MYLIINLKLNITTCMAISSIRRFQRSVLFLIEINFYKTPRLPLGKKSPNILEYFLATRLEMLRTLFSINIKAFIIIIASIKKLYLGTINEPISRCNTTLNEHDFLAWQYWLPRIIHQRGTVSRVPLTA